MKPTKMIVLTVIFYFTGAWGPSRYLSIAFFIEIPCG